MGNQTAVLRWGDRRRTSSPPTNVDHGKRLKVAMLGASGVGKTTLFRRLLDQTSSEGYTPTTSVNIGAKLVLLEGQPSVLVELWDVPNRVYTGKSIFEKYLEELDGALLVYDVASTSSWWSVVEYRALLSTHAITSRATDTQSPLVIAVVGNKLDSLSTPNSPSEAMRLAQEWTIQQQQQQEQSHTWVYHTTVSAARQLHTLELLRTLINALLKDMPCTDVAISNAAI